VGADTASDDSTLTDNPVDGFITTGGQHTTEIATKTPADYQSRLSLPTTGQRYVMLCCILL
jgi:hypothetical protein